MILRKQSIKKSSEEVSMMISYTEADVKKAMQKFYSLLADSCGHTYAVNTPVTELTVLHFFECDTFHYFVSKYRSQLAQWAFAMAIRHKLLIPSSDNMETINYYFLSEILARKRGRPRLADDEE